MNHSFQFQFSLSGNIRNYLPVDLLKAFDSEQKVSHFGVMRHLEQLHANALSHADNFANIPHTQRAACQILVGLLRQTKEEVAKFIDNYDREQDGDSDEFAVESWDSLLFVDYDVEEATTDVRIRNAHEAVQKIRTGLMKRTKSDTLRLLDQLFIELTPETTEETA